MAPQIEAILEELPVGVMVCKRLQLCGHSASVDLVSTDRCGEGHQYWCQSTMHAATCKVSLEEYIRSVVEYVGLTCNYACESGSILEFLEQGIAALNWILVHL